MSLSNDIEVYLNTWIYNETGRRTRPENVFLYTNCQGEINQKHNQSFYAM